MKYLAGTASLIFLRKALVWNKTTFPLSNFPNLQVVFVNELKAHSQFWGKFWQLKVLWKWWKMLFMSPERLFSFTRYLNFCLEFLIMQRNGFIRKIRLISKFVTLQPGKQRIIIHILHNISRSKDKQTMKFGQLIEYKKEIFFLKNHAQIWWRSYSQTLFEHISGSLV